jgi:two-component system phosphate regulon sensor histidine kinase PhoR
MYVAVPVYRNGSLAAIVRTSVPVTAINEALGAILHRILVGALVATGLIAAVSLWISLRISGPLEELKVGAERFARGELDHRLRSSSTEEIGGLAEAMNRMAEQLDERIQTVLRQQNELEAVLGSMDEGVLAVDNEGTVLNLNEACGKLLGSDPEKLKGRIVHEVIRKSDFLQFVESSLSSPSSVEGDIRICDTEDRWFNARGTALYDAQRRKIGVLIVFHDVTRLRRLEKVRSDFVANVSHELKTPITSIKGFVETLLDGAVRDEENAVRFLRIVSRQVNRLEAIVEDLLTLSQGHLHPTGVRQDVDGRDERLPAGAGGRQPDRQRDQVQRDREHGRRHGRAGATRNRHSRGGQRPRHRAQTPAASVRTLLSGRQGPES